VQSINHLVNNVAAHDDLAREAQEMGLMWLILNAESTVRGHRGKISFYAAETDFEVDPSVFVARGYLLGRLRAHGRIGHSCFGAARIDI
jgi:hypothetical protein